MRSDLTHDQLDWLNTRPRTMLTCDLVVQFVAQFNLDARQAGRLLAMWARSLP